MLDESDALARLFAALPEPQPESVPVAEAAGRFILESPLATVPLPGFDNSAMDGYALHAADCGVTGRLLRLAGEQPAGPDRSLTVAPGAAVRVFTGAPLPAATAAVVMQEDVERAADGIIVREAAAAGEFIRRAGSDLCRGQQLFAAGTRLTAAAAGLAASQGLTTLHCGRRPTVAVLCTGAELVPPGAPLPGPGFLYNSNGPMLAALLGREAAAISHHHAPDEPQALAAALASLLDAADVLVVAGGMSVGEHDLVRPALTSLGVATDFWRVRMKPGKPFLFGRAASGKPVFGLPGNPVSAGVTALLFVLPALRRMAGAAQPALPRCRAVAAAPLANKGDRPHWLRGSWDPLAGTFTAAGPQESHALGAFARADALARLEAGVSLAAGDPLEVLPLS